MVTFLFCFIHIIVYVFMYTHNGEDALAEGVHEVPCWLTGLASLDYTVHISGI